MKAQLLGDHRENGDSKQVEQVPFLARLINPLPQGLKPGTAVVVVQQIPAFIFSMFATGWKVVALDESPAQIGGQDLADRRFSRT